MHYLKKPLKFFWRLSPPLVTFILLIMGVLLLFLKTGAENKLSLAQLAMIAATLKQELVTLKLQKSMPTYEGQKSYEIGLQAELKGDREFAQQKYETTLQAYTKAFYYLKKAFDEPNDSTFFASTRILKNGATSADPGSVEEAWLGDQEITLETKKIYNDAIERARSALVLEDRNSRREKVHDITAAKHMDTLVESKLERTKDEYQPTEMHQQVLVEPEPAPSLIESSSDLRDSFTPLDYEKIEQRIENLIERYEESLNNKDLQGIKILFQGHFTEADEKIWKEFFKQVKNIGVTVLKENLEIDGDTANVILSVFIEYLSHDGSKPIRRGFVETWILEVQQADLVFSLRKTTP